MADRVPGDRPRLLVVSNHLPPDLHRALKQVKKTFDVTLVGQQTHLGATPRRVGPDLVAEHDAVVSIGKTVQYALLAGRAIYCYDRFGGPGWLDAENTDRAALTNFSGRGFDKRTPAALARELVEGWESGLAFARSYRETAAQRYQLSNALRDLQARIAASTPPSGAPGRDVAATSLLLDRHLRSTTVAKDKPVAELKAAKAQIESLTSERDALRAELDQHRASRAYRLARRYRKIRRALAGRTAHR